MKSIPFRLAWVLAAAAFVLSSACGTQAAALPASSPPPPQTELPSATAEYLPPTEIVAPTVTASPAATATAEIGELNDTSIEEQVDKLATWFLGQNRNPGLGVAVVMRDPQTGQLKQMLLNYGTLGKGESLQTTPDTIYEIGSITKVFTGLLLAEAVRSGKMHLNDPIQDYLPSNIHAPNYGGTPITLDDLATHRSGLPRDINTDTIPEMYDWLNGYQLSRKPGTEYSYSNVGFSLLGDIVARAAGTDFDTLEYQSVSKPLGMLDSKEALPSEEQDRIAQGYTYDGSPAQFFPDSGAMSGAGYLRSTLKDMTRFLVANMQPDSTPLGDSIQLSQTLQAAGRNPGTGVGLGWEIDQLGTTHERLYKGGATYGFSSYITFLRDGSAGFVLLTDGMYGETLVPHMLHILNMEP